ncbi:hypothetical protein BGX20_005850, partial [Mortierella sp. AD010]
RRDKLLESAFYVQGYKQPKDDIARNLAGALIHSGSQALLILKVEVYGRVETDDSHSFDLAMSTNGVSIVTMIDYDNCKKL